MKRLPMILVAVLVFQVALAAFTLWPRQAGAGAGSGAPLFGKLTANDVVALTIYDNPTTSLALKKQGDKWTLPNAEDFPADGGKVSALLDKLAALKTNRLVTRTENSQARLKVAANDYLHRVDFQTADGVNHTLYIGSSSGVRATHVRSGDQNEVYLADDLTPSDASAVPGSWIDANYLNVAAADVTGFTLKNANGEFKFTRDGSNWTLAGLNANEKLNADSVTSLVNLFAPLRMDRPLGKTARAEYGLDKPAAELTVVTKKDNQEKTYTLQVGANKDSGDNTYVAKSSDSTYYVRVNETSVRDLIDKKRDAFLQLPPTPAVQGPAAPGAQPGVATPQP